jgi:RNA polymerase sigma factor (sigma-70 family)
MTDDAERLQKYAEQRDQSAFSEFVRRNVDLVYSAAFRQTGGDAHLAEDIAQKVFVAAAQKAAALCRHPVIGAWLYQTTRYAAIDTIRSRQRQQAREAAAGQMAETTSQPNLTMEWDEVSPELDKIVASLGERDRDAIVLRFFGGKSFADIGTELHLSEGAARMRVERALEKLRTRLSRLGINSSCAALSAILAEKGVMAAPAGLGTAAIATALSAPAAAGLATVLGTLQIMTSTKIVLSVATIVTLASLATAVHQYRHACLAEQALADNTNSRQSTKRASPSPAETRTNQPQTQPDRVAANHATTVPPAQPNNPFSALMDLLSNSAMQKQTEVAAKVRLDGQYSALFKSLNLTPPQIDQFKNLLVEKQMVGFDSMSAAHQHGINPSSDPQGFFQAVMDAEKTVDAQISALLGADGYQQFQKYQESVPARNTSNLLSLALSYTSEPLTETKTNAVIQILTQHGTPPLPPGNPFAVLNGDLGIIKLNEQGLAQIQGILSPPQVQTLQTKMQEQLQLLQARERMGKNQ